MSFPPSGDCVSVFTLVLGSRHNQSPVFHTKFRALAHGGPPAGVRGDPPPHGLAPLKPTVSPRGRRGAHPRLHLGVLALPGDGGHLTDFVANLWSIGALVTLYNTGEAQTMVLLGAVQR